MLPRCAGARAVVRAGPVGVAGPIGAEEFEGLMAPLGPFGRERRVVVGVSGGADSLALAVLLQRWGRPLAVVVDHGLRRESAEEAALTTERLAGLGVPAVVVTLDGLGRGADLGARARAARYAALLRVCRERGIPDLLVAHHVQDQVETALLREARGSGAAGLAAMPAIGWRADARIVRPLLPVEPARLRATLIEAGLGWVEDPSNLDEGTARGALRSRALDLASGVRRVGLAGRTRWAQEMLLGGELGRNVAMFPGGYATVSASLSEAGWSALVRTVSGRPYPPAPYAIQRLAVLRSGTLHGVLVRHGAVLREPAAVAAPVVAISGAIWDRRFVVRRTVPGAMVGAGGVDAGRLRRQFGMQSVVRQGIPVMRLGTDLFMSCDVAYGACATWLKDGLEFRPARPLAGAPFVLAQEGRRGQGMHIG